MKSFQYVIEDELGIHARPAGQLAKLAKGYPDTTVTISQGGKSARMSQLMRLMNLGVKCGSEVTVTAEGPQEEDAINKLQEFFQDNL